MMNDIQYWLNENGPLALSLEGFRVREQQLAMANTIDQAITEKQVLLWRRERVREKPMLI